MYITLCTTVCLAAIWREKNKYSSTNLWLVCR